MLLVFLSTAAECANGMDSVSEVFRIVSLDILFISVIPSDIQDIGARG